MSILPSAMEHYLSPAMSAKRLTKRIVRIEELILGAVGVAVWSYVALVIALH